MNRFYLLTFVLASSLIFGCTKNKEPLKETPPLLLMPKYEGYRLSDIELKGISLSYVINLETRKTVPDFKRASGDDYQKGILSSYDVAKLSTVEKVKTFYLSYPSGNEDTFNIDYKQLTDEEARKDLCFCNKTLVSISRNGTPVVKDGENKDGIPIYSFEK